MKSRLIKEEWRQVRGYEGLYMVSDLGRVISMNYLRTGREMILKPRSQGKGYLGVSLWKNCKSERYYLHRLVWEAFVGKIPEGLQVNHINEDKTDNRLENLNLMTRKENINWGTGNKRRAEANTNGKRSKPVVQLTLDGKFVKLWSSTAECGRNGFSHGNISLCCRGKLKSHKGFRWMYAEDFFKMLPEI